MDAHYTFTGPEFSTQLAPSDQVAVYNYSPRILVFRLNESSNQEDIVSILREGIQELVNVFPDLAGSCTQPPQSRCG